MSDLLLDQSTGDLVISNRDVVLITKLEDLARQRTSIRLNTYLGEWFANRNVGVPYFESILIKSYDKPFIDTLLRAKILEDESIIEIISFESSVVGGKYNLIFKAGIVAGGITEFSGQITGL